MLKFPNVKIVYRLLNDSKEFADFDEVVKFWQESEANGLPVVEVKQVIILSPAV